MSELKLGKILNGTEQRDAFHVAVAPVVAGTELTPGERVGLKYNSTEIVLPSTKCAIGIVDPFLQCTVQQGERFYLWLYPNTVTGMRHHWEHPAFPDAVAVSANNDSRSASEQWLRNFAESINQTYSNLMEAADDWDKHREYTHAGENEDYKNAGDGEWREFWMHWQQVTGRVPTDAEGYFFTCSC